MLDSVLNRISMIFASIPFSAATWFVLFTMAFMIWLFAKANKDPKSPVQWEHLIIDSSNDRASPYKTGYLVGLIVATWIVVTLADKDKLGLDIFGAYLTYLLGGVGANMMGKKTTPPALTPASADADDTPAK